MEAIVKSVDKKEQIVFAEVYAPMRPDTDGEFMTVEDVKRMAYRFMKSLRLSSIDSDHNHVMIDGACVVESFIARKGDPVFIEGSWVVGVHIPDKKQWARVESGDLNSFSLEGYSFKEDAVIEIEVPPVISGTTSENAGHSHKFYVAYTEDGSFAGGTTDVVNGHSHVIKRGSATEEAAGHRHRFSHVDDMIITTIE